MRAWVRLAGLALASVTASATFVGLLAGPAAANTTCINWSNDTSYGHALGSACYDSSTDQTNVYGWVTDDDSDGYCVYVRVYWTDDYQDSPWACPNGTTIYFSFYHPGDSWVHNTLPKINAS